MTDRILVADDSLTIQKVIKIALSRYAADVSCINSFLEVSSDLKQRSADLLVLDANIPGAQGVEDFRLLKESFPKLPILLLAGSHEVIDEEAFKKSGFDHFLKKPFESSDLIKKIVQILGRPLPSSEKTQLAKSDVPKTPQKKEPPAIEAPSYKPTFTFGTQTESRDINDINEFDLGLPPPPPKLVDESLKGKKAFEEMAKELLKSRGKGEGGILPPLPKEIPFDIGDDADVFPDEKKSFRKDLDRELSQEPENSDLESFIPKLKVDAKEFSLESAESPERHEEDIRSHVPKDVSQVSHISKNEIEAEVRKIVEEYCKKHFASIAREVLTAELRRLAEERSRYLLDT